MGSIYLASLRREGGFERVLAVKRILPHLADDPAFVAMFEAEARLAARLHHPNVVQIYDFGRVDGEAYIAMEYVDGFDLRTLVELGKAQGRPLPLGVALQIVGECARALEYAWSGVDGRGEPLRIIHRDVSPQNILVSMQGETKLTDFGLAKTLARDSGSMSGLLKGKLGYMAPEQVRGEEVSLRTDLFALGAVLYELAAGVRLYPPELAVGELVARVSDCRFRPVRDVAPELPSAIASVLEAMLSARAADRPASHAELAAMLRAAADSAQVPTGAHELAAYASPLSERRRLILERAADGTAVARRPKGAILTSPTVVAVPGRTTEPDSSPHADTIAARKPDATADTLAVADVPAAGLNSLVTVAATAAGRPKPTRRETLRLDPAELPRSPQDPAPARSRWWLLGAVAAAVAVAATSWWFVSESTAEPSPEPSSAPAVAAAPAPTPPPAPRPEHREAETPAPPRVSPPTPVPVATSVTAVIESRESEDFEPRSERRPLVASLPFRPPPPLPVPPPLPTKLWVRIGKDKHTLSVGESATVAILKGGLDARVKATVVAPGRVRLDVAAKRFAEVTVDGRPEGATPADANLRLGRHTVDLTRPNEPPIRFQVVIKPAE